VELFKDKVGSEGSGGELSEVSASGGCQLPGGSTYVIYLVIVHKHHRFARRVGLVSCLIDTLRLDHLSRTYYT
jgi:hypothetical protein